jgi:hypothetical protein
VAVAPIRGFGLEFVSLDGELDERLAEVPASAGVAQLLAPEGRNLLIGRASNLRRWAASHLGAGPPPPRGKRPPTNLRPVARSLAHVSTASPFEQKLAYERLMARHVPAAQRRDLKPPVFLHLDPTERFPRLTIRHAGAGAASLFGPFRDKKAAEHARNALHKAYPLRPCDYVFEPDPALPVGLGCLFAQVRSCSAPCLSRISEDDYRGLARDTAARLAKPTGREADLGLPVWVGALEESRGLVVDVTKERVGLFPVAEGRVHESEAVAGAPDEIEEALDRLEWEAAAGEGDSDWPWLLPWIASLKGKGSYVPLEDEPEQEAVRARLREVLTLTLRRPSRGKA